MHRPILSIIALSVIAATCKSATAAPTEPPLAASGAFFALSVADMAASRAWYVEKLGLNVSLEVARTDASKTAVTVLQGGGLTVELARHDDAVPRTSSEAVQTFGAFKVGLVVNNFDAALSALQSRGVQIAFGPFPRQGNQPANVIIRDNSGNLIQIIGN